MGLRDHLARKATSAAAAAAGVRESVMDRWDDVARLRELHDLDDDREVSPEAFVTMLVGAVRDDEPEPGSDRDVEDAAKRRQRRLGAVGAFGGPTGIYLTSLYCEVAILCDLVEARGLDLSDQQVAAHLLVLWQVLPGYREAVGAIDGTGPSIAQTFSRRATDRLPEMTTKRGVLTSLWRLRGAIDDVRDGMDDSPLPGSARARHVILPGGRVREVIARVERQLALHVPQPAGEPNIVPASLHPAKGYGT